MDKNGQRYAAILRRLVCAVSVFAASGIAMPVSAATVTLQDGVNGYAGTKDTYIDPGCLTCSRDYDIYLQAGFTSARTLIRFSIFASEGGPVPNGAGIVSATLQLDAAFFDARAADYLQAHRLLRNWEETQASWNYAANGILWASPGASAAGVDMASTADGQTYASGPGWLSLNVTPSVQSYAAGAGNYGWRVSKVSALRAVSFFGRTYFSTTVRPKLVIEYLFPPSAPKDLDAAVQGSAIALRWTDTSTDETLFRIERSTANGGGFTEIGTVAANATTYTDSGVLPNTAYFYRVRAGNAQGSSGYSNEAGAMITPVPNVATGTVEYAYDHFGDLVQINAGGAITTMAYDPRGRKTAVSDPDMGSWTYTYDVLGELVSQTDAKGQTATMAYDKLGRMISRAEADLISNWLYDTCVKGVGKICQVTAANGFARSYAYDNIGRISQIATTLDGTPYTVGYGYDSSGRLSQTTYPTGFVAKNLYNATGYLQKLTDGSGTAVFWQLNAMNAFGQASAESQGNALTTTRTYDTLGRQKTNVVAGSAGTLQSLSYEYDPIGNVARRTDAVQSVVENFYYDNLNRVELSSGPGLVTRSYAYDARGNITYKSDVGTYTYGAKPHAVASVSGTLNATYGYDANGNLTSGNGRTITYTSYNMPATLAGNGFTYQYTYDANHERVRLVHSTLGTFLYLHPSGNGDLLYEKETRPGGLVEHKHYLSAGQTLVGVHLTRSDSTQETRYFHHDHLGSLTLISNASGAAVERLAYEAFGKRRFPNGTADPGNTLFGVTTDRGFTEHEHLDEIGLIHMNGRIYDPLLARFMTPDPGVPHPTNLQSFNRYSYARNNPLVIVDPSGFDDLGGSNFGFDPSNPSSSSNIMISVSLGGGLGFCTAIDASSYVSFLIAGAITPGNISPSGGIALPGGVDLLTHALDHSMGGAMLKAAGLVGSAIESGFGWLAQVTGLTSAAEGLKDYGADGGRSGLLYVAGAMVDRDNAGTVISTVFPWGAATKLLRGAEKLNTVFWAGGRAAEDAARAFANANNGVIMTDTAAGRALAQATEGMSWTEARLQTLKASQDFARAASGEVNVFQNARGLSLDSLWRSEYSILMQNPNVTRINYHIVMPNGTAVRLP